MPFLHSLTFKTNQNLKMPEYNVNNNGKAGPTFKIRITIHLVHSPTFSSTNEYMSFLYKKIFGTKILKLSLQHFRPKVSAHR